MSEYIKYNGAGIYCLTNERSGKKYIGSSKNIGLRVDQHQAALKAGRHENPPMQADYNNGDRFSVSIVTKVACDHQKELFVKEREAIDRMKRDGEMLYNMQPMNGDYFLSKETIEKSFLDMFCKEHFGMTAERFFYRSQAAYNMMYKIFCEPENEKEIREEYEPIIKYQNRDRFYRHRVGITYDEYLSLTEEEQKEVNRKALNRRY